MRTEGLVLASATAKPKPAALQLASAEPGAAAVAARLDASNATDTGNREDVASNADRSEREASPSKSANDVINERGYWRGLPNMGPVEAAKAPSTRPVPTPRRPAVVASADPAVSASIAPWPLADGKGDESLPNALAYAAQPAPIAAARPLPMGTGSPRAAPAAQGDTTIALKRSDDRPTVTLPQVTGPKPPGTNAVQVGDRFNDPWMRAMIVSPSAEDFMKMTLLGAQDFRNLGPYLHKPAATVVMTFSENPHLGMSSEKFSGTAVVFVATVTFGPARTAALR